MWNRIVIVVLLALTGCAHQGAGGPDGGAPKWAIAIHGGAGVISKDMPEDVKRGYFESLRRALALGRDMLKDGAGALDVCEAVVRMLEDDPRFNAGKGSVFTAERKHELDASIMDGSTLACGAVTGVTTVRHPITLARAVMERTPHVFLMGDGAETFATEVGVQRVDNSWFDTEKRLEQWKARQASRKKGTVGCVVRDSHGHLAAATSTGGMTMKRYGRIGDSPVIGAGTYANDRTCAVSCTGTGEEFIRHTVARDVASQMEYRALAVEEAARAVVFGKLAKGDGGLIAVCRDGEIALVFNCPGMFRGAATSAGRFDVAIWE